MVEESKGDSVTFCRAHSVLHSCQWLPDWDGKNFVTGGIEEDFWTFSKALERSYNYNQNVTGCP